MKKTVILLAAAILVVSCDLPQGGNKSRVKKEGDVVRYDDPNAPHGTYKPAVENESVVKVVTDSVKTTVTEEKPATETPKAEH